MHSSAILLICLLGLAEAGLLPWRLPEPSLLVVKLQGKDLKPFLQTHLHSLVVFCESFEKILPEIQKAADVLMNDTFGSGFVAVDVTLEPELAQQYKIEGSPAVLWFSMMSKPIQYRGGMNATKLVDWFRILVGEARAKISNRYEFDSLIASAQTVVIGFFKNMESEPAKTFRQLVANSLVEIRKWGKYGTAPFAFPFAITSEHAIFEAAGAQDGQIGIFKRFHKHREPTVFANVGDLNQTREVIFENFVPLVLDVPSKYLTYLMFSGKVNYTLALALDKAASTEYDAIAEDYLKTARLFYGRVRFVVIDTAGEYSAHFLPIFQIPPSERQQMRLLSFDPNNFGSFKPADESNLSPTVLSSFVQDVLDGKVKGEAPPIDW